MRKQSLIHLSTKAKGQRYLSLISTHVSVLDYRRLIWYRICFIFLFNWLGISLDLDCKEMLTTEDVNGGTQAIESLQPIESFENGSVNDGAFPLHIETFNVVIPKHNGTIYNTCVGKECKHSYHGQNLTRNDNLLISDSEKVMNRDGGLDTHEIERSTTETEDIHLRFPYSSQSGNDDSGDCLVGINSGIKRKNKKSKIQQNAENIQERKEEDIFIDLLDRRREYVSRTLYNAIKGEVQDGPFQGLKLVKDIKHLRESNEDESVASWGDFDLASKLLGFYEDELYSYLEEIINIWKPDSVLNIGCADGFYGVGLAKRLGVSSQVIMVDIVRDYLDMAIENTLVNEINLDKIQFWLQRKDENLIARLLKDARTPFLLVDCEGCELNYLLSPNIGNIEIEGMDGGGSNNLNQTENALIASILKRSILLVETHDFVYRGILQTLVQRFQDSHDITVIPQGPKNPQKSSIISQLHELDKWLIVNENRPEVSSRK